MGAQSPDDLEARDKLWPAKLDSLAMLAAQILEMAY